MGGSSGGGISTLDLTKITSAANERIQQAFSRERKILIVCGADDLDYLSGVISRTVLPQGVQFEILSEVADANVTRISEFNIVVGFVHLSVDHAAINTAIQVATAQKKTCLFVRSGDQSPMPQYVLQYRIRCLTWQELMEMVRA